MISLDFSSETLAAFDRQLLLAFGEFDRAISAIFAAWTRKVFTGLVQGTPQWSGDLAANWNYSVGAPDYSYEDTLKQTVDTFLLNVKQRGDMEAVSIALSRMESVPPPTWRDVVYFNNETPIAPMVESELIFIRPVNLIDGRVAMVQYTIDHIDRYQP